MYKCTLSKEEYDNNEFINLPQAFGCKLRAKQGKIVKEFNGQNGQKKYVLEFDEKITMPKNVESGLLEIIRNEMEIDNG